MNQTGSAVKNGARPLSILGKIALVGGAAYAIKTLASRGPAAKDPAKWHGKTVLITGGSRGLGLALAYEFGARGCRLALNARDEQELNEACRRLHERGVEAVPFVADISRSDETAPLIARVIEHFGKLDVLVNNAGEIQVAPLEGLTHEHFESAMNLMFWAPVNLSLAALPHMSQNRSGQIVNITSIGGLVSVPHLLPYSCAKFACVGFSTGLAAEVRSRGIHVLTVAPGLMRTGSYLNAKFGGKAKAEFAWFSLSGNLPGLSIAAETAAKTVLVALEKKQFQCTISLPAKLLAAAASLLPDTTRLLMSYVNAILPNASQPTPLVPGKQLNATMNTVFQAFTTLGKGAARRFNE